MIIFFSRSLLLNLISCGTINIPKMILSIQGFLCYIVKNNKLNDSTFHISLAYLFQDC